MPAVSVALATYNGEAFLRQQLDSLARQTRRPDALVVRDDRSSDGTLAILHDFARTAPFPVDVAVNPERLGYRDNFLSAASACAPGYVAFCDQDDVWLERKLERCVERIERTGALLCVHAATLVGPDLAPRDLFPQGLRGDVVLPPLSLPPFFTYYGFSQVFRRDLLDAFPGLRPEGDLPFGKPISHDRWITLLADVFGSIAGIAEPLVLYRQHGGNSSGAQRRPRRRDALAKVLSPVRAEEERERGRLCAERALLFRGYAGAHEGPWAGAAARAADRYEAFARRFAARARFYAEASLLRRAGQIAGAVREGAYRPPGGAGFGRNDLVKDLARVLTLSRAGLRR